MARAKLNLTGLRFDLIPTYGMAHLAHVYTVGAKKHGENNWRGGMKVSYCLSKLFRHLFRWMRGERYDKDDGQHHLASVAFWCMAMMEFEDNPIWNDYHYNNGLEQMNAEKGPLCAST